MNNCVAIVALMAAAIRGKCRWRKPLRPPSGRGRLASGTWQVDGNHTAAQFSVKHMMVVDRARDARAGNGDHRLRRQVASRASRPTSLSTSPASTPANEKRDKDLRSDNFFDVAKYPDDHVQVQARRAGGRGKASG